MKTREADNEGVLVRTGGNNILLLPRDAPGSWKSSTMKKNRSLRKRQSETHLDVVSTLAFLTTVVLLAFSTGD